MNRKMWKVIAPIEARNGGGKFWSRCGSAFTNKDQSINIYLDTIPVRGEITLQLREITEEELRQNAERRALSPRATESHVADRHAAGFASAPVVAEESFHSNVAPF